VRLKKKKKKKLIVCCTDMFVKGAVSTYNIFCILKLKKLFGI
jgi:hypothetical protein